MKSCTVIDVTIKYKWYNDEEEVFHHVSNKHSLEALKLRKISGKVLPFFLGCSQLKSFELVASVQLADDADYFYDFLANQVCLKKLNYHGTSLAWNRLTCIQLKELDLHACCDDDVEAATEFLKK